MYSKNGLHLLPVVIQGIQKTFFSTSKPMTGIYMIVHD